MVVQGRGSQNIKISQIYNNTASELTALQKHVKGHVLRKKVGAVFILLTSYSVYY